MSEARSGYSIGIVFHNEGEKILASLNGIAKAMSRMAQDSSEPTELIFVDNCSTLNCCEIIRDFCQRHQLSYKLIKNDANNMARARNRCVTEASYDKLLFIDADCVPQEDWLTSYNKLVATLSPLGFAAIGGENIPPTEASLFYLSCRLLKQNPFVYLSSTQLLPASQIKEVRHIPTCNALYLRRFIQEAGGFNEDFARAGEDLELNARLIKKGLKIYHAPGLAVEHRDKTQLTNWFKKIFRYGSVQPRILIFQGSGLDYERWIPVAVLAAALGGLLFYTREVVLCAFVFISVVSAMTVLKGQKLKIAPYFFVFLSGTVFSYLLGYFIGFCKMPEIFLKSKDAEPLEANGEVS